MTPFNLSWWRDPSNYWMHDGVVLYFAAWIFAIVGAVLIGFILAG